MRVLQLYTYFVPTGGAGGIAPYIHQLSSALVRRGHEVTIYATDAKNPEKGESVKTIDGIEVHAFPNTCKTEKVYLCFSPEMARTMSTELKDFDVIHLHAYRSIMGILTFLYARKNHIPYIVQAHGSLPHKDRIRIPRTIFDATLGKVILNRAASVIALNDTEHSLYQKMGVNPDRIARAENGIDPPQTIPEPGKARTRWGIGPDQKIILYLGRIHKSKGIDLLIEALAHSPDLKERTTLLLIGPDYGDRNRLEKLAARLGVRNKVVFTGFVDERVKNSALIDCDVFATPNYTGLPGSMLEACLFGKPIFTTSRADLLDWLPEVGLIADWDKADTATNISELLGNQQLSRSLGERGKQLATERFSWEKIAAVVEKIYQHCIEGPNS